VGILYLDKAVDKNAGRYYRIRMIVTGSVRCNQHSTIWAKRTSCSIKPINFVAVASSKEGIHIMESRNAGEIAGAQAVARSTQLLKLVSERDGRGHLVPELVSKSGLTRPTVYRLLGALQAAGLVEQDERGRWHLGAECYVLGTLAAPRFNLEQLAEESLARISDVTGESSFLSIRRGVETVCLVRNEGTYAIRTHVLQAGDRLPLGIASAGIAMLALLSNEEVEAILAAQAVTAKHRFPRLSPKVIQQLVVEARAAGYAVNPGLLLRGSWGVAAVVGNGF
jgi:DNA-binding IclR family transcriptional regulator